MKGEIEKRNASGAVDHIALFLTTWGVGYIPGAPGTYGSVVGVAIYLGIVAVETRGWFGIGIPFHWAMNAMLLMILCLVGIWASGRTAAIFGKKDPSQAVVDEVMGQIITLCFVPFAVSWQFVVAGFLLFRAFDIWKPYPVRDLEILPGGLGICGDDIVAGVYAGICLAAAYAIYLVV